MYSVHAFAIAAQLLPVLSSYGPTVVWSSAEHQSCAPHTAVLSKHGDLAAIFDKNVATPRFIYVRRRHRQPDILEIPDAPATSDDTRRFQKHIADVAVAGDGASFATVETFFSGAYSGNDEAPIVRAPGHSWKPLPFKNVLGTTNATIAGVASSSRFVVNGDFGNEVMNLDLAETDPNYRRPRSELVSGGTATSLGYGVATALSGDFVSGYLSDSPYRRAPGKRFPNVEALLWRNGARTDLGRGVACDVNVHGVAVGSNEETFGAGGRPVVWQVGGSRTIGSGDGMAYAINDSGVVVGSIGQRAFVYASQARSPQPTWLDTLVADKTWHIDTAYGISNDGEILAIGHKSGHRSELLLLSP